MHHLKADCWHNSFLLSEEEFRKHHHNTHNVKIHTFTISAQNTTSHPRAQAPTADSTQDWDLLQTSLRVRRNGHCEPWTTVGNISDQGKTHWQRPRERDDPHHTHLILKQRYRHMDFSLFNFLTQGWKAELLTSQWRGSQDMGLPVLKASQLQAMQFGHQTCPLRVDTTSITAIVQIMLWVPNTLHTWPQACWNLHNLLSWVYSWLCPWYSCLYAPREDRALCRHVGGAQPRGWGVYGHDGGYTWDWLSPSLHVWYGILRSERINLNVDFRVILKVSFSRWHNRTPFIYLLAWFII